VKAFGAPDVTGILRNVVEAMPRPAHEVNSETPPSLSRFMERLFAKAPDDRFASAVEALEELQRIRQEIGVIGEETPELVTDEISGAHSTMAIARKKTVEQDSVPPGVTEPDYNDNTPPVGMRAAPLWHEIPAGVFWSVVAAALLAFGGSALAIRARTDNRPTTTFTPAQVRTFEAKKEQLRAARALMLAGKIDEAVAAYDAYLARYPKSPAAQKERLDAKAALDKAKAAKSKMTVTAKPAEKKSKEPEKKPSLFNRIFRRGNTPPPQQQQPKPQQKKPATKKP
jgi:hypothetical protein